jgi:polyisoprenyl-phosphate glycosyltransferase
MPPDDALFSLVVPVFNEEEVLPGTAEALTRLLDGLGRPYEVVVVDNGSSDRTPQIAEGLCRRDPRWRYLRLSRNFGYQNSVTAGMLACQGEAIMVIDVDLQDPPELIPEFLGRWREGYDVVYGVRQRRVGEPWYRVWPTMVAMRLLSWLSDEPLPAHSADFRLISRRVRDALARMPETDRYLRGIIHWLGFRQVGISYTRRGRTRGVSKANWAYLVGFTVNAAVNFSIKPIRAFSLLGLGVLAVTALLGLTWVLGPAPALAGVYLLLLANLGVLSLGVGVLGEYVARVYHESKRRPLWLVDYSVNLDARQLRHPTDGAAAAPGPAVCRPRGRAA